jgi:hypothetical protein
VKTPSEQRMWDSFLVNLWTNVNNTFAFTMTMTKSGAVNLPLSVQNCKHLNLYPSVMSFLRPLRSGEWIKFCVVLVASGTQYSSFNGPVRPEKNQHGSQLETERISESCVWHCTYAVRVVWMHESSFVSLLGKQVKTGWFIQICLKIIFTYERAGFILLSAKSNVNI